MPLLRRIALLAVVAAGFGVLSSPALARNTLLPYAVDSVNFRVHYQSNRLGPSGIYAITETQAGDIAALAERALTAELADGYPRPLSDGTLGGDGRIDIYVEDYSKYPGVLGAADWDTFAPTASGSIDLAGNVPEKAFSQHTIAHELFHLIQFAIWIPPYESDDWLLEATAEWMGFRVNGYPTGNGVVPLAMALDCRDPFGTDPAVPPTYDWDKCDRKDDYLGDGYSRWPFFEYVISNQGAGFIKDIFAKGRAGAGSAISSLAAALAAKGTTLAETYNNWIAADVRGGYSVPTLQAKPPEVYGAPIRTGTATAKLAAQKVSVNHLSARILQFDRGGGSATGSCYAATLTLTVTIPAGTLSKPVFYWNMPGTEVVVLSVNGTTATANIPWDTCEWPTGHGYLTLPNASTNVDAADFVVNASLAVNQSVPATASAPPPGMVVTTPVVPVPAGDPALTLSVFGPQLLKFSPTVKQIRLIVESNASGTLQATLGSVALGSQPLRIGNNDVRFTLPAGIFQSVRRSASSSYLLTLTPVSSGGSAGTAVTRQVTIAAADTPTKKPAKKPAKKKKTSR
jgi:hypothetical protein